MSRFSLWTIVLFILLSFGVAEIRGQEATPRDQEARRLRQRLIDATRALEEERVSAAAQRRARETRRRELIGDLGRLRDEKAEFDIRARELSANIKRSTKDLAAAERRRAGFNRALERLAQRGRQALAALRKREALVPPGGSAPGLEFAGLDERLADPLDTRRLGGLRDLLSQLGEEVRRGSLVRLDAQEISVEARRPPAYVLRLGQALSFYRREDGEESGWWDPAATRWRPFDSAGLSWTRTLEMIETARGRQAPGLRPCPLPVLAGEGR